MNEPAGIYIHIPFCLRKCPYCDFYSVKADRETMELYTESIVRNLNALREREITADTVYFGGGTPSLLSPSQVYRILDCVQKNVHLHSPEITLEGNPSSLNADKLYGYRQAGVNRLSVGLQSQNNEELEFLGRLHNAAGAEDAVISAYNAGFDNISCDLMIGLYKQDKASVDYSVNRLLKLPVKHISAYMLKIEQGTPFDTKEIKSMTADDDTMSELYMHLCGRLAENGFEHYEISNFCKPGFYSRHNMKYWTLAPYIGIGAAAHSYIDGKRYACPKDINAFIDNTVQKNVLIDENPNILEEYVMLSLRIADGVSFEKLKSLSSVDFAESFFIFVHFNN